MVFGSPQRHGSETHPVPVSVPPIIPLEQMVPRQQYLLGGVGLLLGEALAQRSFESPAVTDGAV